MSRFVLEKVEQGIHELRIADPDIPCLLGKHWLNDFELLWGEFHRFFLS
jgi:hypothetical protein